MSILQPVEERLDKLEVTFLMLLNSLRATKKVDGETFIVEIPEMVLDYIEKVIVTRPVKKSLG